MAKTRLNKFYSPKVVTAVSFLQIPNYTKKTEASSGVIALIDMLVGDLSKEMHEAETEETDAQASYEVYMKESGAKRSADAKLLAEKAGQRAEAEATLLKNAQMKKDTVKKAEA